MTHIAASTFNSCQATPNARKGRLERSGVHRRNTPISMDEKKGALFLYVLYEPTPIQQIHTVFLGNRCEPTFLTGFGFRLTYIPPFTRKCRTLGTRQYSGRNGNMFPCRSHRNVGLDSD